MNKINDALKESINIQIESAKKELANYETVIANAQNDIQIALQHVLQAKGKLFAYQDVLANIHEKEIKETFDPANPDNPFEG